MLQYTLGKTSARSALWMSIFTVAYPFLMVGFARVHYALTARDLNQKTEAALLLFILPVCVVAVLALLLSLRGEGNTRKAGMACSILGIIVNLFAFVAIGASY